MRLIGTLLRGATGTLARREMLLLYQYGDEKTTKLISGVDGLSSWNCLKLGRILEMSQPIQSLFWQRIMENIAN
jgi:hypothetical protein